jgi:hypothetical protein
MKKNAHADAVQSVVNAFPEKTTSMTEAAVNAFPEKTIWRTEAAVNAFLEKTIWRTEAVVQRISVIQVNATVHVSAASL